MAEIPEDALDAAAQAIHDLDCAGKHPLSTVPNHAGPYEERAEAALKAAALFLAAQEREAARVAILERDELRGANVTPEDADRPLGQSVEYWQDRCLDHATALDAARIRVRELEAERLTPEDRDALIEATRQAYDLAKGMAERGNRDYIDTPFGRAVAKLRARASSPASVDPGGEA